MPSSVPPGDADPEGSRIAPCFAVGSRTALSAEQGGNEDRHRAESDDAPGHHPVVPLRSPDTGYGTPLHIPAGR